MKSGAKWIEYVAVAEAVLIRVGGLILVTIFIVKAIIHEVTR